jgi:predicted molibdopterin-dependent oxidoreductase YjgC
MFRRWSSPEAAFQLLAQVTRGQPCDITGITGYDMLEEMRGVQWPLPKGSRADVGSERRLFEDGQFYHHDRKARFCHRDPEPLPEAVNHEYPFTLLTGRGSSSQWHTLTRTGKSALLCKLGANDPYVEMSPVDAAALGIAPSGRVLVQSRRGRMAARAFVTHSVQPKQVFIPMHFVDTNQLTFAAFDRRSRQPAYKACAVKVRPLADGEQV